MQNSLILASGSPRRRELLSLMGITYQICPADVDEHMTGAPDEVVMALSRRKALAVAERHSGCTVLGADTLVACRGEIMGKPQDQQDAMRMLMLLSGGENNVYTGVTVIDGKTGRVDTRCDQTRVHFVPITHEAAQRYIDSGEPMDKAGAYGAQGMGGMFVSAIEGSPSNVIGLPIHLVRQMLMEIGWQL